ncbi:unnamed protein product [Caenorhabditis angaria]|uniref:Uncharacterized protein n=1 Tax=Caenorhabditis angaria TaxID=860376 RepID=A0A9P1I3Z2_9PELO|nr:unnamed protein product [Caenorhabditis angaria]
MLITLIFCLSFALQINAGVVSTSSSFNMTEELEKIEKTCLSDEEHNELSGNQYKRGWATLFNSPTISMAIDVIGQTELREALGIPQYSGSYEDYKSPISEEEFKSTSNLEEYFEWITMSKIGDDAQNYAITDKDVITAIRFLDKKWPAIRIIFKNQLEELIERIRRQGFRIGKNDNMKSQKRKMDRKVMYKVYYEYLGIWEKIFSATGGMYENKACRKYTRPDTSMLHFKTLKGCVKHTWL